MKVKVLGTGNAFNQQSRFNSSYLININGINVLIDCGFTVPLALQNEGVEFSSIDYILITHYHGDHYAGLASILLGLKYISPQHKKLTIIGPGNIETKIKSLMDVLYPGNIHLFNELNLNLKSVSILGDKLKTNDFNLEVFPMVHSEMTLPIGYIFEKKNIKIGFSGDTCWHSGLIPFIQSCDKLIIECNFSCKIGDAHLSVEELELSDLIRSKKKHVFLTHLSSESAKKALEYGYNILSDGDDLYFES